MQYALQGSELYKLLISGKQAKLPRGQIIQISEERMLLSTPRSGYIKRYSITSDGSQSIQAIYGPGDVFPLTPIFKIIFNEQIYRGEEVIYYETMTPTILHSINKEALIKAIEHNPILYKDLLYVCGLRLSSNIQRLENTSLRVANRKVAHQLLYFADKFGKKTDEGIEIQLPLTHQILADILNLARETVTKSLDRLHEKGLIKLAKNIVVPDVDKLRREIR